MPRELLVSHTTGRNVYAAIRVPLNYPEGNIGSWYDALGATFGVFLAGSWANYAIAMTELGTTGLYEGNMPTFTGGERALEVYYFERLGAVPAMTDTKINGALFNLLDEWVVINNLDV